MPINAHSDGSSARIYYKVVNGKIESSSSKEGASVTKIMHLLLKDSSAIGSIRQVDKASLLRAYENRYLSRQLPTFIKNILRWLTKVSPHELKTLKDLLSTSEPEGDVQKSISQLQNHAGSDSEIIRACASDLKKQLIDITQTDKKAILAAFQNMLSNGLQQLGEFLKSKDRCKDHYPVHPLYHLLYELQLIVGSDCKYTEKESLVLAACKNLLSTNTLLQKHFSNDQSLLDLILGSPEFLKTIVEDGPQLAQQAQLQGIAKLSRKTVKDLPGSLVAIRSSDGTKVTLGVTAHPLGRGTYKIAKGLHILSETDTSAVEDAKVSLRKKRKIHHSDLEDIEKEAHVSKKLQDAGAQHILRSRVVTYNSKPHLYCKRCRRGNVEDVLLKGSFSRQIALQFALEQAKTLNIMHNQCKLCHLDLKLENVMVDGDPSEPTSLTTKLGDFGTAEPIDNKTKIGCTATYPPPEMKYKGPLIPVDPAIDMWSFGVMLHRLFHPKVNLYSLAFNKQGTLDQDALLKNIQENCGKSKDPVDGLIARLFSVDPKMRPTATQAVEVLSSIPRGERV